MRHYTKASKHKVKISYKFLSFELLILKRLHTTHRFSFDKITHHFQLNRDLGIDPTKIETTVPSILVQGLDAHIVHMLFHLMKEVNSELHAAGLPEIHVYANHDNFAINTNMLIS